ncbi:hypothetical protein [Fluoribacter gormanii]|uniref:Serine/threonine-protein kinase n=1 Tax=Fluoribacter gormanii TaxID=464 RepID=A0A377GFT4_9GAMM|nr:hypothetical protein [Fluoribacter gormanii]KTD02409.1 serine/threonine-protein kinase [Fluoribacter gormanii]SIR68002.1 hypothetical protein SAMN05421777_1198 [Fluoribacter gormanii]STO23689.1 Uncharacterised protein [Fluoribacter gormanii]
MRHFFQEVRQLPGKEKLNVHALLITKLSLYKAEEPQDKLFIRSIIPELKSLFHNHTQSFITLAFTLKHHLKQHPNISEPLKFFINHVIEITKDSDFKNYFKKTKISAEDLECRIARIFESNIATIMLQNPSKTTWACIDKVSNHIIQFIESNYNEKIFDTFLENIGPDPIEPQNPKLALAFGRYAKTPSLKEIIETLKERRNFARIMLIHFMFMRDVYCHFERPLKSQNHIKSFGYEGSLRQFILENKQADIGTFFWRYSSFPLYHDRGRGEFKFYVSQRLGICIAPEDRRKFPLFETTWNPDCICQEADLDSKYTQSLIHRGIPYVAGPSGMTSLLSASMLFMGQFKSLEEHYHYILAIMSFIVGGGLHSIHETLAVIHERLGLLPSYKADGCHAGNYNDFFKLFRYDEVISQNINRAWGATISWMLETYPELIPIQDYPEPNEASFLEKLNPLFFCCS